MDTQIKPHAFFDSQQKSKRWGNTNKVLIIFRSEKLHEMEELKMRPVNVVLPGSATITILNPHW